MSNETDLDWLARNVHVWPSGDHQPWCYVYMAHGGVMKAAENFLDAVSKHTMITIDQWLARRAELQSVTEQFKPSIEEANKMAQEFSLLTSIEDNQEREMKQDNGWFERVELPPVGAVCLYVVSDRISAEVEITAHAKFGICFVRVGQSGESYVSKTAELHRFRPIRTERDVLMSVLEHYSGALPKEHQRSEVAHAILAAGFKLDSK